MSKGFLDISLIIAGIFALILAIFIIISYNINQSMKTSMEQSGAISQTNIDMGMGNAQTAVKSFNIGFAIIIFGLGFADIISAFLIRTHPVFFVIFIILTILNGLIIPLFSNAYYSFATTSGLDVSQFTLLDWIMKNINFLFAGFSFITAIVMFSKTRSEGL